MASPRELFDLHADMARRIARGFRRHLPATVDRSDLEAAALGGLWEAVQRHRNYPEDDFAYYASTRIRGAVIDELRRQDWLPRRERKRPDGFRTVEYFAEHVHKNDLARYPSLVFFPDADGDEIDYQRKLKRMYRAIDMLPKRERSILRSIAKGSTMKQIAGRLHVSEPRISQLAARASKWLHEYLVQHEPLGPKIAQVKEATKRSQRRGRY